MVAYSFQRQFCDPILARTKGGTIRAEGHRRHAEPGDALQLYFGMRTRQCRLIARQTCLSSRPIRLDLFAGQVQLPTSEDAPGQPAIDITDVSALDAFARFDGFEDFDAMRAFWREVHESLRRWRGRHIRWLDWPAGLAG